jgi:predicted CXXCH cytochrome family protein
MRAAAALARRARPARALASIAAFVAGALLLAAPPARAAGDSCIECHRGLDDPRLRAPALGFPHDIHAERGLTCASCHGGNPSDPDVTAMDPDKGFKGAPTRDQVAPLCASCHANAEFMKHYNPRPYIFSLAEWKTSVHCKRESLGDQKVATCTGCHGVHGIRPPNDPASPVFKTNVPRTCAKCHNAEYMKGRTVRTDQFALYSKSVHGVALLVKGDVSAPACNDCHGNHGAAPPGLKDVSLVCGTCHGREAELFEGSRMKARMDVLGKPGCVACHSNHGVRHPTDAMLAVGHDGVCSGCHEPGSAADRDTRAIIASFHGLRGSLTEADSLLKLAEVRGMETSPGRESLKDAQDRLVAVRAGIHSFDPKKIGDALQDGAATAAKAAGYGRGALRDWRNRRLGMAASLGVILVLIALVVAKIRQIERKPGASPEGPAVG